MLPPEALGLAPIVMVTGCRMRRIFASIGQEAQRRPGTENEEQRRSTGCYSSKEFSKRSPRLSYKRDDVKRTKLRSDVQKKLLAP